jgi:parvulin-like peptidyl-prolyl isomerase
MFTLNFSVLLFAGEDTTPQAPRRVTLDCILAYVEGNPLFKSDVAQPRIAKEGERYSLDELIREELWFQRAIKMHMLPSATDVERQLTTFRLQNNFSDLSDVEFEDQLKKFGFTIKSYKAQLGRLGAVERAKSAELSEKIMITTQEVESFYKDHPEYTKEEYHLNLASVDENKQPQEWEDLGWVAREDIGEKFAQVLSMAPGEISKPIETDEKTTQLIKLVDKKEKRLKTLDERYRDIEQTIQKERSETFVTSFEKELLDHASITYMN